MNTYVFTLVILAAISHALWNFLSKKISGNLLAFWLGSILIDICLLPYSIYIIIHNGFNMTGLIPVIISAVAHSLYYLTLFGSYKLGDISAVYPIARGTGVAGTAVIAVLFMHDHVSHLGTAGIFLIVAGIIFVGLTKDVSREQKLSYLLAIVTGCFIIMYSLADSVGSGTNNPIVYLNAISIFSLVPVAPMAFKNGFKKSIEENKHILKYAPLIGLGSLGTYLIILYAFTLAPTASYIIALRESSVIIASILGFIFLKEQPNKQKILGIILITAGLILIKLA